MPPRGLPGNANLEQLKNGAKSFQRAVRAGDPGAAEVVREFHPRMPDAQPRAPELERFTGGRRPGVCWWRLQGPGGPYGWGRA